MNKVMKKIKKWLKFLQQYPSVRILISSIQDFIANKGFDKASTLTFYSLMSIIPMLAIGFGVALLFGLSERFKEEVIIQLSSQKEIAEKLIEFANTTLATTRGGVIASFGIVILFWTVMNTIRNIESFFNEIWGVKNPRTFLQEVKSYLPLIVLLPIFLVGSSSVVVYLSQIENSFLHFVLQWIPYLVNWSLLSFFYIYLPNTHVSWKAGFIAGAITGMIFLIWQWVYVTFQVHASSYGVIYGSFAAIPLFLVWLNYSWLIFFFGCQLSYEIHRDN